MSETVKLLSSDDDVTTNNDVTRKSKLFSIKKASKFTKNNCSAKNRKQTEYIPGTLIKGKKILL